MITTEQILEISKKKGLIKSRDIVSAFDVSRQYANRLLSRLVDEKKLVKLGSTRSARYTTAEYIQKHPGVAPNVCTIQLTNKNLEEHVVLDDIEKRFALFDCLPENIKSIVIYALSEMLNNAIEHSGSKRIRVTILLVDSELSFVVDDFGIGVYRNIMQNRGLQSEMEAIQDLLKGKTTTAPKLHSGEGIFFTSKVGDEFILDSYGYQFITNTIIDDIFVNKVKGQKQGTRVTFRINTNDTHHLNDIFRAYTGTGDKSSYGFDKTEVYIRLYTHGGVHISRSQARRVLSGLEKFKVVVLDYEQVPMIGQAFADEVYRVFQKKYPSIKLENINMNEAVRFMIDRAKHEAEKDRP